MAIPSGIFKNHIKQNYLSDSDYKCYPQAQNQA